MIVYNVNRSFFPMKNDAETLRKSEGLPPSATSKIEIKTREDLADLLNGLCALAPETPAALPTVDEAADVPRFLRDAWRKYETPAG